MGIHFKLLRTVSVQDYGIASEDHLTSAMILGMYSLYPLECSR